MGVGIASGVGIAKDTVEGLKEAESLVDLALVGIEVGTDIALNIGLGFGAKWLEDNVLHLKGNADVVKEVVVPENGGGSVNTQTSGESEGVKKVEVEDSEKTVVNEEDTEEIGVDTEGTKKVEVEDSEETVVNEEDTEEVEVDTEDTKKVEVEDSEETVVNEEDTREVEVDAEGAKKVEVEDSEEIIVNEEDTEEVDVNADGVEKVGMN